jgi:RNA-binding protein YlmH
VCSLCNPFFACRKEVAQILEQAERAAVRWEVTYTHFYSPPVVADALAVLEQMADVTAVAWGGYPQAERCRIAMGREDVMMVRVLLFALQSRSPRLP